MYLGVTAKESKDDKQGHELSSNLLVLECVPETGERSEYLEVDKQISVVVEGTRFVLESSGARVDSPGDRRKHHSLPHCLPQTCSTVSSLLSICQPVSALVFWI